MRKVIDTDIIDWQTEDYLKSILGIDRLPRLIIIETLEEL